MFRDRYAVKGGGQFHTEFERFKRSCVDLASEMQCPHHFKNARVEMDGENFGDFSMEVIACCEGFRSRVEEALNELVDARSSKRFVAGTVQTGAKRIRPSPLP